MRPLTMGVMLLLILSLAACAGGPMPPIPTPTPLADILNTHWVLTDTRDGPPPPDIIITLNIESKRLIGNAGCNNYFYWYEIRPDGTWWFPMREVNVALCVDRRIAVEKHYLSLLDASKRYALQVDTLIIQDNAGQELLRFHRQPIFHPDPERLIGHVWRPIEAPDITQDMLKAFTLRFDKTIFTITGPCETLTATYQQQNGRFQILGMKSEGRIPCNQNEKTAQERFLSLLSQAELFDIQGDRLSLYAPDGKTSLVLNLLP